MCQSNDVLLHRQANTNNCELADVFHQHSHEYRTKYRLSTPQHKVMRAVELCRTPALGGHVDQCDSCGAIKQSYNSCRNRHCPKCQSVAKAKWVQARETDLIPVEYFHVVFTLPHELNALSRANQTLIYDLLFQSAWKAVNTCGRDPKRLDGQMGMTAMLHTWGQNLSLHNHLHCLIPGIALSDDMQQFNQAKAGFLFPVKVLSRLFRGAYVNALRQAYNENKLEFKGECATAKNKRVFDKLLSDLMKKDWVVYTKPPFAGPSQVLNYIGRYTHKIAISNHRILSCESNQVRFKWRDYANGNRKKIMTLHADEFIRRFLLHVLPLRFVRMRYFGFMANSCRKKKLKVIRHLLTANNKVRGDHTQDKDKNVADDNATLILQLTGIDVTKCPVCKEGKLRRIETVARPSDTRRSIAWRSLDFWDTS